MDNIEFRNQWLETKIKDIPEGKSIIDVGAGELRWKKACNHLAYVSQDFCQYNGVGDDKALQSGNFDTSHIDIVSDIINIPVEEGSFDVVLCSEVLEHVPYPELAVKEMSRILRNGGELLLTARYVVLRIWLLIFSIMVLVNIGMKKFWRNMVW